MASDHNLFKIENFGFRYPDETGRILWQGIHEISNGEHILLSGASGSGKSTLLYGLMGLLPEIIYGTISGDIKFQGQSVIADPGCVKGKAGLVLQNPAAQMLCKTVEEELAFGLENMRLPVAKIRQTIHSYARRFEIEHLLTRRSDSLSGGEKQKITLLSILMTNPQILMLDEPTAFLDPRSANEVMEIVLSLSDERTLIFVEHNLHFLKNLITRNLHLMKSGEVIERQAAEICWKPQLPPLLADTGSKCLITMDNIWFSYDKNKLLQGINLKLHEGEIVCIRGRNGSGKSTLLQIIAGLITPDKGKVYTKRNQRKADCNELRKLCSLLFQNPENHFIYNHVFEELADCQIDELKQEFTEKRQQSPFTLSEGQKRRLSTAIACSAGKKVLLLDEPTFGQDLDNKIQLIKLLEKLSNQGMGIIIVSHDEAFITAVGSSIYELSAGRLN